MPAFADVNQDGRLDLLVEAVILEHLSISIHHCDCIKISMHPITACV